jgi:tryptophanyl-tRNA synthetase
METVVSGIRSTGNLHIGNYFGAVKNFIKMQEQENCFFFIADYHALTTHPNPEILRKNVRQVLAEYLACGLDPEKCTLYVQSDIPETAELYLLMNMSAYLGELERATTFKDKARSQPDNINAGLLTYPVLMAADILIHKAAKVPVGKDQEQHLEMTRQFGNRFNRLYNVNYFPEPIAYNFGEQLVKIPGLDGAGKMGKSEGEGNAIFLADSADVLKKKVMKAVTDSGPTEPNSEKPESIQNLFTLMSVVSKPETVQYFEETFNNCTVRFGDLKKQLAEDMELFVAPLRDQINSFTSDDQYLKKVMKMGKEKAHSSSSKTVKEVREIMGINY